MKILLFLIVLAVPLAAIAQDSGGTPTKFPNPQLPLRTPVDKTVFSPFFDCLKTAVLNSDEQITQIYNITGPIAVRNPSIPVVHAVRYTFSTEYTGYNREVDLSFLSDDKEGWQPQGEPFGIFQAQAAATMRRLANLIHFKRDNQGHWSRLLDRIDISTCASLN
jgi:hypothetical protein